MEAGSLLGDTFRIEEPLGEGGMGAVYAARHVRTQKRYAVKVLHPDRAQASPDAVARFRREASALSELGHPGIVAIHDFARTDEGVDYLVMDLLAGEDLAQRLKREGPMNYAKALGLLKPIAAALGVAHRAGIVHRDLKPGNIFIVMADGIQDRPMILDFGLVKFDDQRPGEPLTASGVVMGTPAYLSPEQALGQDLDHRTDVYALATLFYEMVSGVTPFEANTMTALLLKIMTAPPPPLSTRALVPAHVDGVMGRALAKDLGDRYESATAFVDALESGDAVAGADASGDGKASAPLELPLHNAHTVRANALTPEAVPIVERAPKKRGYAAVAAVVALLVVVAGGAWYVGTTSQAPGQPAGLVSLESEGPAEPQPLVDDPSEAEALAVVPVPALDNPAPESPALDNPAPESPALDNPALDSPALDSPALEAPDEQPDRSASRRAVSMSGGGHQHERPAPSMVDRADEPEVAMSATPAPNATMSTAVTEANRLQVARYQAQVDEIGRFLALLPRVRREVEGLSSGRAPALCASSVRAQLATESDVAIVVSRGQTLRDAVQRICEPFEQIIDPPAEVRGQLLRIDDTLDHAEGMARDRSISTNTPPAVADQVIAAIRDTRAKLQGVAHAQRPFPCNDEVFTRLRRLGSAGNVWAGAAADRVVQLRDRICRRLGMDAAQLRQQAQQFARRLDDTEGALRQTQRTLQRVADGYGAGQ